MTVDDTEIARRLEAFNHFHTAEECSGKSVETPTMDVVLRELMCEIGGGQEINISPHRRHKKCLRNADCDCIVDDFFPLECKLEEVSNGKALLELGHELAVKLRKTGFYLFRIEEPDDVPIGIFYPKPTETAIGFFECWHGPRPIKIPVKEMSATGPVLTLRLLMAYTEYLKCRS